MTANGFFLGDENVQKLDSGNTVSQPYEYTKNHWLVHFKWVKFMDVCICGYGMWLYLNKAISKIYVLI